MGLLIRSAVSKAQPQRFSYILLLLIFLALNLRLYRLNLTSEDHYISLMKTFSELRTVS